jgi:hypothetical protein
MTSFMGILCWAESVTRASDIMAPSIFFILGPVRLRSMADHGARQLVRATERSGQLGSARPFPTTTRNKTCHTPAPVRTIWSPLLGFYLSHLAPPPLRRQLNPAPSPRSHGGEEAKVRRRETAEAPPPAGCRRRRGCRRLEAPPLRRLQAAPGG